MRLYRNLQRYLVNYYFLSVVSINLPFEPNTKDFPSLNTLAKNFVLSILISNDEGYFLNTV